MDKPSSLTQNPKTQIVTPHVDMIKGIKENQSDVVIDAPVLLHSCETRTNTGSMIIKKSTLIDNQEMALRTHAGIPQGMHDLALNEHDIAIANLGAQLYQEKQEHQEQLLAKDLAYKDLKKKKHELEELKNHLQADVQRFAYYLNSEEIHHGMTKKELEASQTIVHELHKLREQMQKEAQALQSQIKQIILTENQRRQQDESTIQGLQSSVQALTTQNNQLHNNVNHLHYALATLVDDPEEEPQEDLMEDETMGEGEILDN